MGYYDNPRIELLSHYPSHLGRVLEFGCGAGAHGRLLLERSIATAVDGIDINEDVSVAARGHLTNFDCCSVEDFIGSRVLFSYDTVLAHDVLEHLEDPWSVLDNLASSLHPGAMVVASIPNLRFISVVLNLFLRGRFRYEDSGILDRTHLRFFTRDSIALAFSAAGFSEFSIRPIRHPGQRFWARLIAHILQDLGCRQYVVVARVASSSESIEAPMPPIDRLASGGSASGVDL